MSESEKSLRSEAEDIIQQVTLFEILDQYGEARLVGSCALDLIVKLDIDIHLVVGTTDLLSVVDSIYHQLLECRRVKEVRISDYRDQGGVKIGVDRYPGASGIWSIDIWVTDRVETTGFALVDRLKQELQPEHRKAILMIKEAYHRRGKLRKSLSAMIYRAVIDNGVRSIEGFRQFLSSRGRSDLA